MTTVGILAIAFGRYTVFWKELYESCEKYFLPGYKKEYYLFTDDVNVVYHDKDNVHIVYHEKMGWPYDTMMRFDLFLSQKEKLSKLDYLYFLNINLVCKKPVGEEIIPDESHDGIMVCSHPGFYNKTPKEFTYDRNPESTAYIPEGEGYHYAPGGFNGGTSKDFLKLCEVCSKNVHTDLDKGIIALWHDESHLNKYILDKHPLIMPINYMYPVGVKWLKEKVYSKDIKIALRDKTRYGGHYWLRSEIDIKSTLLNRLKYRLLSNFAPSHDARVKYREIKNKLYFGM